MANSIIIRSEKCNDELQKSVKSATGSVCLTTVILAVLSFVVLCWNVIMAKLTGTRIYISDAFAPVNLILCIILLVIAIVYPVVFLVKIGKKAKEYKEYIETETLSVCEQNVYGTTIYGDFSLKYDQIDSVRVYPNNKDKNKKGIVLFVLNNLEIRDKSGKVYTFYTIKNGADIKSAIDQQRNSI